MELLHLNGLGRIVGQLQTGDMHLTQVREWHAPKVLTAC